MKTRTFLIWICTLTFLSFLLRFFIGPNPLYGAAFDDELMVKAAASIVKGDWTGTYGQIGHIGLSKPVGYALFLVASSWLPFAPTDVVHLLLLGGFLLVLRELSFWGINRKILAVSYGLFCFYPPLFNESISRVYRDGFLGALTISIFGLALMSSRKIRTHSKEPSKRRLISVLVTSLTLGLMVGLFVITKNTWHFIVVLVTGSVLFDYLTNKDRLISRRNWITGVLCSFSAALVGTAFVIGFVMQKNEEMYGVRMIDTFSYGAFPDAMKSIYSINDVVDRPYVDVSASSRATLYSISPTFNLLRPYLELPDSQGWRGSSCASLMKICDESGAWFPWDLRDAIQSSGLGKTATEFETTLTKISSEIDDACKTKRISCGRKGIAPGLDSINSLSPRLVINSFSYGIAELLNPKSGFAMRATTPDITKETFETWSSVVNRLPNGGTSTEYHNRGFFLSDLRFLLGTVYTSFWIPLVLLGLFGLVFRFNRRDIRAVIGILIITASSLLIFQISLLEASSGVYMIPGAELYLICLFPLIFAAITLGISRLYDAIASKSR